MPSRWRMRGKLSPYFILARPLLLVLLRSTAKSRDEYEKERERDEDYTHSGWHGMRWVAERSRMDSKETSSYATCLSVKRFLNLNQTRFTMVERKFLSNEHHLEGVLLRFCARLCVSDSFLDVGSPICIPGGDRKQSSPISLQSLL